MTQERPDGVLFDPVLEYGVKLSEANGVLRIETWANPGGGPGVKHIHPNAEERFEVLDGDFTFTVGRRRVRLGPGGRVTVPAGTPHSFRNAGDREGHLVAELEPALEMARYFEEIMALAAERAYTRRGIPRGPRSLAKLAELIDRTGHLTVITSPPPFLQRLVMPPLARLERARRRRGERRAAA